MSISTSEFYRRRRLIRRQQMLKRRKFMINFSCFIIFGGLNLLLAFWAWPKVAELRRRKREKSKQDKLLKRNVRTSERTTKH